MKTMQTSFESIKTGPELRKFESSWIHTVIPGQEWKILMNFRDNQYPGR